MRLLAGLLCGVAGACSVSGCASLEAAPPARGLIEVTTHAGEGCTSEDAKNASSKAAAFETLERGFAGYTVVAGGFVKDSGGTAGAQLASAAVGDDPKDYSQVIMVLHRADPDFAEATDARKQLGPQWRSIVRQGFMVPCATT